MVSENGPLVSMWSGFIIQITTSLGNVGDAMDITRAVVTENAERVKNKDTMLAQSIAKAFGTEEWDQQRRMYGREPEAECYGDWNDPNYEVQIRDEHDIVDGPR